MTTKAETPHAQTRQTIDRLARRHGTTFQAVMEPSKAQAHVRPRRQVYLDLRIEYGWSLPRMGRRLMRDHTTILYGIRAAATERFGTPPKASLAMIAERAAQVAS